MGVPVQFRIYGCPGSVAVRFMGVPVQTPVQTSAAIYECPCLEKPVLA